MGCKYSTLAHWEPSGGCVDAIQNFTREERYIPADENRFPWCIETFKQQPCALNGDCVLSDWTIDGDCDSVTLKQPWRRDIYDAPSGTGKPCETRAEERSCEVIHCEMSEWSAWTDCDAQGYKTRTRTQVRAPEGGGRECPYSLDKVMCCEKDCRVSDWGPWTCDGSRAKLVRQRTIVQPNKDDGAECPVLEETGAACSTPEVLLAGGNKWSECALNAATASFSEARDGGRGEQQSRKCPFQDLVDWVDRHGYSGTYITTNPGAFGIKLGEPSAAYLNGKFLGSMQPYDGVSAPTSLVFSGGNCPAGGEFTVKLQLKCGNVNFSPEVNADPTSCVFSGSLSLPTLEVCSLPTATA